MLGVGIFSVSILLLTFLTIRIEASICIGKHFRMPENILKRNISKIDFDKFSVIPPRGTYENTGETVLIKYEFDQIIPIMRLGPFEAESYSLEFLYFHWLNESLMQKDEFPAELHIVFKNTRYKTLDQALKMDMGVAVAAFKNRIDNRDGINIFHEIVDEIPDPYQIFNVPPPATLGLYRIAQFTSSYYIYRGKSLIPGKTCSADVIWLDYEEPLYLRRRQIPLFRKLKSFDGVPLMSVMTHYNPPKGPIFYAVDIYLYQTNNLKAPHFHGLNSASTTYAYLLPILIALIYLYV